MVCICKRAFGQNALFLTFSPLLFTLSCLKIRLYFRLDNVKQMSSVSTFLLLILFVYVASRLSSSVYYHISAVYLISLLRKATVFCKCLSKKLPTKFLLFILNESISPSLFVSSHESDCHRLWKPRLPKTTGQSFCIKLKNVFKVQVSAPLHKSSKILFITASGHKHLFCHK